MDALLARYKAAAAQGGGKVALRILLRPRRPAGPGEAFGERIDRLPVYRRALAGLGFVPQEREIFWAKNFVAPDGKEVDPKLWTAGQAAVIRQAALDCPPTSYRCRSLNPCC